MAAVLLMAWAMSAEVAAGVPSAGLCFTASFPADSRIYHFLQDYVAAVCSKVGVSCRLKSVPVSRAVMLLRTGRSDGDFVRMASFVHDQHLTGYITLPVAPFSFSPAAAWVDPGYRTRRWDDLRGRPWRIGYQHGVALVEGQLQRYAPPAQLVPVDNLLQCLQMLRASRLELCAGAIQNLREAMRHSGPGTTVVLGALPGRVDMFPLLNQRHQALAPAFAQAMRTMQADGETARLLQAAGYSGGR